MRLVGNFGFRFRKLLPPLCWRETMECVAKPFGESVRMRLETFQYSNGRTAIQVLGWHENDLSMERTNEHGAVEDGWEPYATITVNLPDADLEADEVVIKNWTENSWVGQLLELMPDVFQDTGKRIKTGFVEAPVWKFTPKPEVTSADECEHEIDWGSVSLAYDGEMYIDVNCKKCGHSGCLGSVKWLEKEVCW